MRHRIWQSEEQEILARATVHEVPRRPGEDALSYIERIAVCAGLMEPEQALRNDPKKTKWVDPKEVPGGVREDDNRP